MGRPLGPIPIYDYPPRHAVVLLVLGRFEEALSILNKDADLAAIQPRPIGEWVRWCRRHAPKTGGRRKQPRCGNIVRPTVAQGV